MINHCCIVCSGGFSGARDEGQGRWGREASAPVAQAPSEALSGESIHVHDALCHYSHRMLFPSSAVACILEERALLTSSHNDQEPLHRCCEHTHTHNIVVSELGAA